MQTNTRTITGQIAQTPQVLEVEIDLLQRIESGELGPLPQKTQTRLENLRRHYQRLFEYEKDSGAKSRCHIGCKPNNENCQPSPNLQLFIHQVQALELDRLAEMLGEVHDDTGEAAPGWLGYYIGTRREQIATSITRLQAAASSKAKTSITPH